jgi:hypothetical protein
MSATLDPSDPRRVTCAVQLAVNEIRQSDATLGAVNDWAQRAAPLVEQFRYTPWEEIPTAIRPSIEAEGVSIHREATARKAIKLGAAVSSMECAPEYPNCAQLTAEDAGKIYAIVINDALTAVVQAAMEQLQATQNFSLAIKLDTIWIELARHAELKARTLKTAEAFWRMLPASAALPSLVWPEPAERPSECAGIVGRAVGN